MYKRTRHFFEREYCIDYANKSVNIDECKNWFFSFLDFAFRWFSVTGEYALFFLFLFFAVKKFLHIDLMVRFDLFIWVLAVFFLIWQICYYYLPYKSLAWVNMALEIMPYGILSNKYKLSIGLNNNKLIIIKLKSYWKYRLNFAGSCARSVSSISYKKINFLSKRLLVIKFARPVSGIVNFEYLAFVPLSKIHIF